MVSPKHAIEFKGVTKRFGELVANEDVSFGIAEGTVHGVVGENGAGKSTIMKTLYGLYRPDEGEILVNGKPTEIKSPHDAIALGIGMVHQHFMLVPPLPVWKNIILGAEPSFKLNAKATIAELDALQKSFGLRLNLETPLENLSVGEEQQVEILKLLYRKANILILDEPTAVLTPQEVDLLFERLQELNRAGRTIILITHKLHEILRFTNNVTVMRQGKVVTTVPTKELDEPKLAELIIGRKAKPLAKVRAAEERTLSPVLSLKNVTLHPKKAPRPKLDDISFDLFPGEVLGVAGISGNGQQELIEIISGVEHHYQGDATMLGRAIKDWKTYDIKQKGFGLIPADRNEDGLIGPFTVQDNLTLGHHLEPRFSKGIYRSNSKIAKVTAPLLDQYDIRPRSLTAKVGRLSGGNQQKVIIAREVDDNLKFLLAAYPTRGVDIGAIEFIYELFQKKKQAGAGILLISSELEELFALSDRLLVLFDGKIAGVADPKTITPRDIGMLMTGCQIA